MIKKSKQINKGTVKAQKDKAEIKKKAKTIDPTVGLPKKVVNKNVVWECLCCKQRVVSEVKPEQCPCSNPNYVVNNNYTVKE